MIIERINLAEFSVVSGETLYRVPVPQAPETALSVEIYANEPVTVWFANGKSKVPMAVTDRCLLKRRVVGLHALEITASKKTAIAYSIKGSPVIDSQEYDPEPLAIEGPDPEELAHQREIRRAVEQELSRLGIDPETMVEEELDDEAAFEDESDELDFPDRFADELLYESEMPEPLSGDGETGERQSERQPGDDESDDKGAASSTPDDQDESGDGVSEKQPGVKAASRVL